MIEGSGSVPRTNESGSELLNTMYLAVPPIKVRKIPGLSPYSVSGSNGGRGCESVANPDPHSTECFWASRIRILPSSSKNVTKNLDFYCFVTFLWLFIFEWCKWTSVPDPDPYVVGPPISESGPLVRGTDPRIRIRIRILISTKMSWIIFFSCWPLLTGPSYWSDTVAENSGNRSGKAHTSSFYIVKFSRKIFRL